jgi:hypothetical protein
MSLLASALPARASAWQMEMASGPSAAHVHGFARASKAVAQPLGEDWDRASTDSPPGSAWDLDLEPPALPSTPAELPRGGRAVFPEYRLVGYCGTPGAPALGELQGDLAIKAKAIEARATHYDGGRKILPVFELIAVVVQALPGPDRKYRQRVADSVVWDYLNAARRAKALLLLNIQPGQSDFFTEAKTFESFLREPDVGLALDPEWAMKPQQQPGDVFGQTTGAAINEVAEYLSRLVTEEHLPEKVLVFHEVVKKVVRDEDTIRAPPGVAIVKSIDGIGPAPKKVGTYGRLMKVAPSDVHAGFKLFFYEDTERGDRLMTPAQVMSLTPQPEYVMYE